MTIRVLVPSMKTGVYPVIVHTAAGTSNTVRVHVKKN